jgi:hypothetical protein
MTLCPDASQQCVCDMREAISVVLACGRNSGY